MPTQNFNTILGNVPMTWPRLIGTAALVLGTVTVADSNIAANETIFLTAQNGGILAGIVRISNINPGVGFTILSTNLLDTANIAYAVY